jgi:ABC-type nitrate/sulfonate/bicarbonate transport system substrate-binding protein
LTFRVAVGDVVSPSYIVATAAVDLGFFADEGVDAEFVPPPLDPGQALRDGEIDFLGNAAYTPLRAFPNWRGVRLLCALAQHSFWLLAVRADLRARQGDLTVLRGRRVSATAEPSLALRQLLIEAGLTPGREVQIVGAPPHDQNASWSRLGIEAITSGIADAYWGNAMRAELGVREGVATVLLDVRRGDGPPSARRHTFAALMTTDRLIAEHPDAAAGAVRAIVRAQRALRADPELASGVGQHWFPTEEARLIAELVGRDAPFYEAAISEDAVAGANAFAEQAGLLSEPVPYEDAVALQFRDLWTG